MKNLRHLRDRSFKADHFGIPPLENYKTKKEDHRDKPSIF